MKKTIRALLIISTLFAIIGCGNNVPSLSDATFDTPPPAMGVEIPLSAGAESKPQNDEEYKSSVKEGAPSWGTYDDLLQIFNDYIEKNADALPGLAINVFTKEDVLLEEFYGFANIKEQLSIDSNTVFDWASITKLLVWVSAMQLYEQGKLDLKADIAQYLPDGFLSDDRYIGLAHRTQAYQDNPITMLRLMNHTSGLDGGRVFVEWGEEIYGLGDELTMFGQLQMSAPGSRQAASNYGTALAAYIVELISGIPFYEYVQINIFTPLNMNHIALLPDLSDNEWVKSQREKLTIYNSALHAVEMLPLNRKPIPMYPAGGAVSTISDMRKFAQALLPDGTGASALFKKAGTLSEMYTQTYNASPSKSWEFSLCHGFMIASFAQSVVGHSGGSPYTCQSDLLIDIERGVGVVISWNRNYDGNNIGRDELFTQIFGKKQS